MPLPVGAMTTVSSPRAMAAQAPAADLAEGEHALGRDVAHEHRHLDHVAPLGARRRQHLAEAVEDLLDLPLEGIGGDRAGRVLCDLTGQENQTPGAADHDRMGIAADRHAGRIDEFEVHAFSPEGCDSVSPHAQRC